MQKEREQRDGRHEGAGIRMKHKTHKITKKGVTASIGGGFGLLNHGLAKAIELSGSLVCAETKG